MSTNVKKFVESVAIEAEQTRDDPMPDSALSTRPNKGVPVSVRITQDEADRISEMARRLEVPVSSLLRGWIVTELTAQREESLTTAIDRIAADVQRLREVAA